MGIKIRPAGAADADALAELAARTFRDTFAADNRPEDMALHLARSYGTLQQRQELIDPNVATLLVEDDGELGGYAQIRFGDAPDCVTGPAPAELWRFYIAQPYHGRGLAQELMTRVATEAQGRGARTLWLGVWERNERAKTFYRKAGFVDVGSQAFLLGNDEQIDRILVRPLTMTTDA